MATSSGGESALQQVRRRGESWVDSDDHATVKLVVGITVLALVLRLVFLGARTAHFDEGRVAYWAWHFGDTGSFAYRYIIHGPLIQHVDRWVFALIGPSDFAMRLPIAVVGGLLPLSALLFRRHLARSEVVALAVLFTLDPVLLYFSRFMRSDVLVAVFMFTAFGFLVRLYDTRKPRYMYAAAVFLAFGFASKENALVYVVTWLGATGLLLAKVLLVPNGFRNALDFARRVPSPRTVRDRAVGLVKRDVGLLVSLVRSFRARHSDAGRVALKYAGHVVFAVLAFGFVSLFFYAPRGAGVDGISHPPVAATAPGYVGFWEGITNPSLFPQLLETTTDRVVDQWGNWLEPGDEKEFGGETYRKHFWTSTSTLIQGSVVVAPLAAVGYLLDRLSYATPERQIPLADRLRYVTPRHLIPFMFYAGFVSIFGYPQGTDIGAPWLAVHFIVPLAVPAAVAVAAIFRWGADGIGATDWSQIGSATLVLFALSLLVAQSAVGQVYTNTTEDSNPMVQFAQPDADLKSDLREMDRLAAANNGSTDVLVYYGEQGVQYDEGNAYVGRDRNSWGESWWNTKPTCMSWYNALPLPWYFAAGDMDVTCESNRQNLGALVRQSPPPVIITQEFDPTVSRAELEAAGYEGETHRMRTSGDRNLFTIWTNEEYATNGTTE